MTSQAAKAVRFLENVWIPMSDGTRLGARLWLPEDAELCPVPALLKFTPYRQVGDATLASHGYAFVLPDIRGSGQSEGPVQDEYVKQEIDDAVEIIAWLAKQPWCTGAVGMFGSSWSGFNSLQVAARRPPALKAIIAQCCSDDRYADDAHYLGGCIVQDMFVWGTFWTAITARPPDPVIVGDQWREQWMRRLEGLEFYVADWLTHQHRDSFWKHGSVNEAFDQIECPVYAVGGWADSYHSAVPRLLAGLQGPRKGLIGPWMHSSFTSPGPSIDWLTESLRWWDYWLKGLDTGIMSEPMYRVWMQEQEHTLGAQHVSGRWVAEDHWPSSRITTKRHFLTDIGITDRVAPETQKVIKSPQTVGLTAPHLCVFDIETEAPSDQRIDDARSITFDSDPLSHDVEILGAPVVTLELSVDKPVAFVAVRLNEVLPTGESTRVTFAVLNLTHRDSHEDPTPLVPGKRYRIRVQLRDHAHIFKTGNRLRVAISTTHWPLIWPSPEPVTLTVYTGGSELSIPVRPPRTEDAQLRSLGSGRFGVSEMERSAEKAEGKVVTSKVVEWDVKQRRQKIRSVPRVAGATTATEISEITDDDPLSARIEYQCRFDHSREELNVTVRATVRMTVGMHSFFLSGHVEAHEAGRQVFSKTWQSEIPRRLV